MVMCVCVSVCALMCVLVLLVLVVRKELYHEVIETNSL